MKLIKLLPFLLVGIIITACQKEELTSDTNTGSGKLVKSMEELNIPSGFDWKLSESITFNITKEKKGLIWITSPDETVVFHKAMHPGQNKSYSVSLSIPTVYDVIKVNGMEVTTNQDVADITLPHKKSTSSTTYVLHFDGSSDYVSIDDASLNGSIPSASSGAPDDFTISTWIYLQSTSGRQPIVSKQGTTEAGNVRGFLFSATNGGLEFELFKNDSDDTDLLSATGLMSVNTWYHVAATYDYVTDGTSVMTLYIDGSSVASTSVAVGPAQANSQPLDIGRYYYSGSYSRYFHGYMEDFRIYSTARSGAAIDGDKTTVPTGTEPDLELSWIFEEGSGTTAGDETANTNDGNITGAVYSNTTVPYNMPDADSDGVEDANDDYPNDPLRAFNNYFPAAGFGSLAFEDLWPGKGDYDFNDIVVDYRFKTVTNASNEVVEIFGTFPVKASGAVLQNGFGFNLPDATSSVYSNMSSLTVQGYDVQESYISLAANGFESGQTRPTVIVFDNFYNVLPKTTPGIGVNTLESNPHVPYDTVEIDISVSGVTLADSDFSLSTWNPFIIKGMDRDMEIHLPDYTPTDLANQGVYGTYFDDSDPLSGKYYKSATGLPWGIDLPVSFDWPEEKADITTVYHHFADWAESGGTVHTDWYNNIASYRNQSLIYTP